MKHSCWKSFSFIVNHLHMNRSFQAFESGVQWTFDFKMFVARLNFINHRIALCCKISLNQFAFSCRTSTKCHADPLVHMFTMWIVSDSKNETRKLISSYPHLKLALKFKTLKSTNSFGTSNVFSCSIERCVPFMSFLVDNSSDIKKNLEP